MSLLCSVVGVLVERGISHAVIGAAALAAHGVSRATADLDLLALDPACLVESLWEPLRRSGAVVEQHLGVLPRDAVELWRRILAPRGEGS